MGTSTSVLIMMEMPENYGGMRALKKKAFEEIKRASLHHILAKHDHNISKTAEESRIHRVELHRRINKYKQDFKESKKLRIEVSHH